MKEDFFKEEKLMKMKKRFLSILLSLVMVLGLMPGMSLTALAAGKTITWESVLSNYDIYTGMSPSGIKKLWN